MSADPPGLDSLTGYIAGRVPSLPMRELPREVLPISLELG
jgi:hypothetical protein